MTGRDASARRIIYFRFLPRYRANGAGGNSRALLPPALKNRYYWGLAYCSLNISSGWGVQSMFLAEPQI